MPVTRKPTVAIVGAGSLASSLAPALDAARYRVTEIISRESASSCRRARQLAAKVGARVVTYSAADITASLVWFCVPDREIRASASAFANLEKGSAAKSLSRSAGSSVYLRVLRGKRFLPALEKGPVRFAFHSSGALPSSELSPLQKKGIATASVHPLMTFVPGAWPSLAGVPFALEGDAAATRLARRIVRDLGGESFSLPASRKPAYHAWATMTSPLLLSFLVTLEQAAQIAGIKPADARRMSLPIIRQTLANYARLGSAKSFSGPIIRGDVEVVAKHLAVLKKNKQPSEVYVTLARAALRNLPSKNRRELERLFLSPHE